MSTTPENSLQTATRWAGKAATAAAYGVAVYGILQPVREPERTRTKAERDLHAENTHFVAEMFIQEAAEVRQMIDAALKITIADEDDFVASAAVIVDRLDMYAYDGSPWSIGDMDQRDPLWPEVQKWVGWAREMLPIWKKIKIVRNKQAKAAEDKELVAAGRKTQLAVELENLNPYFERGFKWLVGLIVIPPILLVLLVIASIFAFAPFIGFEESAKFSQEWALALLRLLPQ